MHVGVCRKEGKHASVAAAAAAAVLAHSAVLQQEAIIQLSVIVMVHSPSFAPSTRLALLSGYPLNPPRVITQGRHMDRLFTICYLPVCLLLLGVVIKFNSMPARPRILTSFASFTLIMLGLPLVGDWQGSAAASVPCQPACWLFRMGNTHVAADSSLQSPVLLAVGDLVGCGALQHLYVCICRLCDQCVH
jgi:hypothetical protein